MEACFVGMKNDENFTVRGGGAMSWSEKAWVRVHANVWLFPLVWVMA